MINLEFGFQIQFINLISHVASTKVSKILFYFHFIQWLEVGSSICRLIGLLYQNEMKDELRIQK